MASLANQTISSSYDGLIKTATDNAVGVSGVQLLEDGSGNSLALSVGRANNGVTITGNLAVDTNTLYVDAANNRVGIGTSSPNSYDVPNLVVEGSTLAGITISESTGAGTGAISFGATAAFDSKARISCDIGLGELFFSTQGSERMRIDSSGRVGIGKTPADEKLEISGALSVEGSLLDHKTNATTLHYFSNSGYLRAYGATSGTGQLIFETGGGGGSTTSEAMRIDSSGRVGIGESNPSNTLTIKDEGYQIAVVDESSGNISEILSSNNAMGFFADRANAIADSTMLFSVDGSERMRIDSDGNVIIKEKAGAFTPATNGLSLSTGYGVSYLFSKSSGGTEADMYYNAANQIFNTGGSERMRIDSSGRVGIGTSSPSNELTIESASGATRATLINTNNAVGGAGVFLSVKNGGTQVSNATLKIDNAGNFIVFTGTTSESERMRINSSGNVGIGTSSPTAFSNSTTLSINNASQGGILELQSNGTSALRLACSASDSALWEPRNNDVLFATNNTERMRIDSSGRILINGSATPTLTNAKLFISRGDQYGLGMWVASGVSNIISSEDNLALGTAGSERMRITSGGYLKASSTGSYVGAGSNFHEIRSNADGLYTCVTSSSSGAPLGLAIEYTSVSPNSTSNEFLYCGDSSASRLLILSNGNVINRNNSYGAISDAKLKENVTDASPKLDDLLQVRVRNFNYIGDDKKQLGVVAQELEEVFPSMIEERNDFEEQEVIDEEGNVTTERVDLGTTTKSVKYSVFVPMLIKAMQEQQEIINDLKARIETLENN